MKAVIGFALVGAVALLLPLGTPMAQEEEQGVMPVAEEMCEHMGTRHMHRMMHGGHGRTMCRGHCEGQSHGMHRGLGGPGLLEMHAEQLELSDEQLAEIEEIWFEHKKSAVRTKAEIKIAEMELKEILGQQPVDFDKAESKIESIGSLRQETRLGMLEAMRESHDVLTEEQVDKLMTLRKHGCCGKMEHGGMTMHGKKVRVMEMKD